MNYTLVGAFVLTLGVVSIGIILWLATGGVMQKKYDIYQAIEDESVAGLNLNAPVKYNGVDVGKVRAITLDPDNPARVNLLFAIEHGTPIREDTVAVLKAQGLTGIAYVELSGGSAASPLLQTVAGNRYPVIRTKPSLSTRLENVLANVAEKLNNTTNTINAILSDPNRVAFSSVLADLAVVSRTIAAREKQIDSGIRDAARTFENTSQATARIGPVMERLGAGAEAVEKMGNEVAITSKSAGKTVDSVGTDVKRFTSETLPELERLMGELTVLSTSLRRVTEQTERDPRGLIFGRKPVPPGPGETANPP